MKKLLRYFCFSLILIIIACAPKVAPPPDLIKEELSLEEILQRAGGRIEAMKAIADINIERNNEPYDFVNASVIVKKPGWVHMRIYKFGMLIRDFVIRDGELHVLSGKNSENLKKLGNEFYNAVFWWDRMENAVMFREGEEYVIESANRVIRLDRGTIIPLQQEIIAFDNHININYSDPEKAEDGAWHPSLMDIFIGDFKFSVRIKKLLKNPDLTEMDFRLNP